jgi:hypothetical protein
MAPKTGRPRGGPQKLAAFRLPPELLARVDAYIPTLQEQAPWAKPTRTDAVRALLAQALDAVERSAAKRR